MFSYSLAGLEVEEGTEAVLEVEENETTYRSQFYQYVGKAFRTPDEDYYSRVRDGLVGKELAENEAELPFRLELATQAPDFGDLSSDDFQAEFVRLFEVAQGGPESPLYGGAYTSDRMGTMEEVVRFYDYFGLKTGEEGALPPDHLTTEMDFMQYLTFKEAATPSPRLAKSYVNAQKDFLERQLLTWLPEFQEKVNGQDPIAFFKWIVDVTVAYAQADLAYILEKQGG